MATAEPGSGLLHRLTPVLDGAGSPEQRRALLAAALAEHRRQGMPLFAAGPSAAPWALAEIAQALARRHPWLLLAGGGATGVLLALTRPQRLVRWSWRWLRPALGAELSHAVHSLLRQGLRHTVAGASAGPAPVSAVRHGVAPSADRAGAGGSLS
jgi:hypothetical protein